MYDYRMVNEPTIMEERFPSEYFSGCSINIYFGDVLIDEIVQLQFTLQEQVMPVYGYNSHTFDDLFRGAKLVQGNFAINFKHNNYLETAIKEAMSKESDDLTYSSDSNNKTIYKSEELVDAFYDDSNQFDKMAEENDKNIWNYDESTDGSGQDRPSFEFGDENDGGFDIRIKYGPYQKEYNTSNMQQARKSHNKKHNKGTVKTINDVFLTGTSQTIELSGQPIKEVYTFVAKDLDREAY